MSRTVLIIEDNEMERSLLSRILNREYSVVEAQNGEEALIVLEQSKDTVSAVILDILMPGMDGYSVLQQIRKNPVYHLTPVIVATSLNDDESYERALACGANGFITKPYRQAVMLHSLRNAIKLYETSTLVEALQRDPLTGLLNRLSFLSEVEKMVQGHTPGYYTLSYVNIDNFKIINDQYGSKKGDEVLIHVAGCLEKATETVKGVCCRITADRFAALFPSALKGTIENAQLHLDVTKITCIDRKISIRIGRYVVDDLSLTADAMLDRAALAENSIKGRYDSYIAEYNDSLRTGLLHEQRIVNDMTGALERGEFEPWFQPQYNHATGAMIGAEALVRWRKDGALVPPYQFIPIFERNGFIYKMDRFIWEEVCILLRRWLDEGKHPLPISVNISRFDILQSDFLSTITGLVEKYRLPVELLRLEITESAFAEGAQIIVNIATELINYGFTVEIDDFGSGYSSLNTLKDVPTQVLKLDMKFFENTQNTRRSGNIIESVVRMAKWLGMSVIAEGVEDKERADYLKSIGCYYIQGYYYAKPMPLEAYESLRAKDEAEPQLSRMQSVDTWDNNAFWDPKSMETLVFNSYVGGACIFEYHGGELEILRCNEEYTRIFSGSFAGDTMMIGGDVLEYLDDANRKNLLANIEKAKSSNEAAACEIRLSDGKGHAMYLRSTVRMIAYAGDRYLFYCVIVDITEQRLAEIKEKESVRQLQVIMDSIEGGVTAVMLENGRQNLLFANDMFFKQLGYTREQFAAELSDPMDVMIPNDKGRVIAEAEANNSPGKSFSTNYRILHRDGSIRWMAGKVTTTILPGRDSLVQLAVTTDVTRDKETAIKMNELLNAIPGGVAVYKVGENIETLYSSDGVTKLTGINEETYEKWRNDDIIANAMFEDDAVKVRKVIAEAASRSEPINTSFRLKHVSGELVWVDLSASMIGEDNKGKIYYAVFTKPTAEAALYKSIVEESAIGTVIIEKNNGKRIIYANPTWRRIEGVPDFTTITGVPLKQALINKETFLSDDVIRKLPYDRFLEFNMYSQTGLSIVVQTRSMIWNGVEAYVCYVTDNTSQIKKEEIQRKLLDNLPCGAGLYKLKNGEMSLVYQNKSYWELVGLNEAAFPDTSVMSAIHPEDAPLIMRELALAIEPNRDVSCDVRLRHLTLGYRPVHLVSRIIGESSGELSLYVTFTPREQAE